MANNKSFNLKTTMDDVIDFVEYGIAPFYHKVKIIYEDASLVSVIIDGAHVRFTELNDDTVEIVLSGKNIKEVQELIEDGIMTN